MVLVSGPMWLMALSCACIRTHVVNEVKCTCDCVVNGGEVYLYLDPCG